MRNLADSLFRQAGAGAGKIALRCAGRAFTFAEIAARVRTVAGGLAAIGIGPGTRVGLMSASRPEFIFYQQAIFALGAVFTPLNIFYRQNEIRHAIHSCGLEFLIVESLLIEHLPPPGDPALRALRAVIAMTDAQQTGTGGFIDSAELIAGSEPLAAPVRLPESALGMMLGTSATTGKSKGVMLTIGNIAANYDRTPAWLGLTSATVILCALPLYNTFALNQCINALMITGGTLVLLLKFDAAACLELIEHERCTFLPAVPTMLQKILDHPHAAERDLSSIERIMTGGAQVPAPLLERVYSKIGAGTVILTGYGLTEATALVSLDRIELGSDGRIKRPQSIGKVLDGMEMKVLREDGSEASTGEVGEICLRGPNVMLGYYEMPADTAAALAGGWLHTGDLGYLDAEDYGYIVDRKKDIIIRGGQNIYPADIESVLYQVPGVAEAAVVRKDDPVFGEVPVAFVALLPGTAVTAEQLIRRCQEELAYFKVPAAVHFLPELPKGPTGKILRRALSHSA
jgi:long-chain acyl-CoA synthetase